MTIGSTSKRRHIATQATLLLYFASADHLAGAAANALYTSKTTQNELIGICGRIIQSTILGRIRAAGVYSLMADEATDVANKEQLAICIRFVDKCCSCSQSLGCEVL